VFRREALGVTLTAIDAMASRPWQRPLVGRLEQLVVHSQLLEGNPLGDPARRPLYVYLPPGCEQAAEGTFPAIYLLQGFAGRLEEWLAPQAGQPTVVEQLDAMIAAGGCPPSVVVFVDAATSCGTSQFLNSAGTGRYMDYLCDEVVPFVDGRYPTLPRREQRGVCGRSSGGYGALVSSMLRPDVFAAAASQAGDALFECSYLPLFPVAARELRERFGGSWSAFRKAVSLTNWRESPTLFAAHGTACAYTPDPQRPGEALLPFDPSSGRLVEEIWMRWLQLDPVRMAAAHVEALRGMRRIYLDAARQDEFFLDLGAQALSAELSRLGVAHTLHLFDGAHDVPPDRCVDAVRDLVLALSVG
jgi:S-formylglutathione hydrolase FrmB